MTVPVRLWNRGFVLACLANIAMFFTVHFLLATIAGYTVGRFAVGDAVGGAAASVFLAGTVVSRLLAGPLIGRFGARPLLLIGFAAFVAAPLLYWASGTVWMLLVVRTLHGMTFGVASSVIAAAAVNRVPEARLSEGTTHYSSSTLIGVASGPLVGLALAGLDFGVVAVTASAVSLLGLGIAWWMDTSPRAAESHSPTPTSAPTPAPTTTAAPADPVSPAVPAAPADPDRPWWAPFVEPGAARPAAIGTMYSLGYAGIVAFLSIHAEHRGLGATAGLFFAVYAVTVLASRLVTGRLMDRRGANIVMVPAFLPFAAGLAVVAVSPTVPVLLIGAVLVGLGYGQLLSAGQVLAATQVPQHRAGMGVSTYFLGIDVGMGLGPLAAGILVQWLGTGTMYWVLAGFVLALLPAYWVLLGRHLSPKEHP